MLIGRQTIPAKLEFKFCRNFVHLSNDAEGETAANHFAGQLNLTVTIMKQRIVLFHVVLKAACFACLLRFENAFHNAFPLLPRAYRTIFFAR